MDYIYAFITGGVLCVIAQLLIDYTKLTPARILVAYVTSGVILTAIGVYDKIVEFGGAGATVPLTGFGYSLATGVKTAIDEVGAFGILLRRRVRRRSRDRRRHCIRLYLRPDLQARRKIICKYFMNLAKNTRFTIGSLREKMVYFSRRLFLCRKEEQKCLKSVCN